MSRVRLKIGDVFTVPIDENRTGVGQGVGTYGKDAYYLAIFDVAAPVGAVDVDAALDSRVLFLALSMDAKVAAGHWAVVDNRSVRSDMPLPAYKEMVGGPDTWMLWTTLASDGVQPGARKRSCCPTVRWLPLCDWRTR